MKKNLSKIMLIAFAGIAMLGMTSCNADEPENELTPAEAQTAYESVKGEYTGYVFFKKRKNNSHELEKDSLPVSSPCFLASSFGKPQLWHYAHY